MMTNEQDSYETVKTAPAPIQLRTSGPFVAITPHISNPDARASAAFYANVRKDLQARGEAV
jgi:hypothetical protein